MKNVNHSRIVLMFVAVGASITAAMATNHFEVVDKTVNITYAVNPVAQNPYNDGVYAAASTVNRWNSLWFHHYENAILGNLTYAVPVGSGLWSFAYDWIIRWTDAPTNVTDAGFSVFYDERQGTTALAILTANASSMKTEVTSIVQPIDIVALATPNQRSVNILIPLTTEQMTGGIEFHRTEDGDMIGHFMVTDLSLTTQFTLVPTSVNARGLGRALITKEIQIRQIDDFIVP